MNSTKSLLLSVLMVSALGAAQAAGPVAKAPAVLPVVQLGALIQAVGPASTVVGPAPLQHDGAERAWANRAAAAAAVPAGLQTARAEALVRRAQQVEKTEAGRTLGDVIGAAAPGAPKASAQEVLVAVNGVLQDFTPEQIEKMPAEQLHGVAGLILDQIKGQRRTVDAGADAVGLAALSEARTAKLIALRAAGTRQTSRTPGDDLRTLPRATLSGVPEQVRQLLPEAKRETPAVKIPAGADAEWFVMQRARAARAVKLAADTVFRRFGSKDEAAAVKAAGRIENGGGFEDSERNTFTDLSGIVMTTTKAQGGRSALPGQKGESFVDFVLPAGMSVLELEQGLYLLPLPGRAPQWLREKGETGPDLAVPVTVLDSGKSR